jgi:hypothetical protein
MFQKIENGTINVAPSQKKKKGKKKCDSTHELISMNHPMSHSLPDNNTCAVSHMETDLKTPSLRPRKRKGSSN